MTTPPPPPYSSDSDSPPPIAMSPPLEPPMDDCTKITLHITVVALGAIAIVASLLLLTIDGAIIVSAVAIITTGCLISFIENGTCCGCCADIPTHRSVHRPLPTDRVHVVHGRRRAQQTTVVLVDGDSSSDDGYFDVGMRGDGVHIVAGTNLRTTAASLHQLVRDPGSGGLLRTRGRGHQVVAGSGKGHHDDGSGVGDFPRASRAGRGGGRGHHVVPGHGTHTHTNR